MPERMRSHAGHVLFLLRPSKYLIATDRCDRQRMILGTYIRDQAHSLIRGDTDHTIISGTMLVVSLEGRVPSTYFTRRFGVQCFLYIFGTSGIAV